MTHKTISLFFTILSATLANVYITYRCSAIRIKFIIYLFIIFIIWHYYLIFKITVAFLRHVSFLSSAIRAGIKARNVFDSDKSRYNLGYIGRGYDYLRGHPNSPRGIVDPGFRLPVVDLSYSWNHTADGFYRTPDNVDVISEPRYILSQKML